MPSIANCQFSHPSRTGGGGGESFSEYSVPSYAFHSTAPNSLSQHNTRPLHSQILIAKRPAHRIHEIANRLAAAVGGKLAQADGIVEFELGAGRVVEEGSGAADGVLARGRVDFLPEGPETVDLGVVQVEDGVARAGECVGQVSSYACGREKGGVGQ